MAATVTTITEKPVYDIQHPGDATTTIIQASDSIPLSKINSNNLAKLSSNTLAPPPRPHSPDTLSLVSADDFAELRLNRIGSRTQQADHTNDIRLEDEKDDIGKSRIRGMWARNKGLFLVLVSQFFGILMNVTTRMLEMGDRDGEEGMHPFQILFARMSITVVLATLYMWLTSVPDFPFGARAVRPLLVARGLGGFFGVYGLYWSLQYLPLADATVLTFLAPTLACWACSKLLNEPFTRVERIGAGISLAGVVLIARPTSLFASSSSSNPTSNEHADGASAHEVTPHQRLAAVGMAMLGVLGAAVAYTTIRWIGQRAHALISVNYFAAWCTFVSFIALAFVPSIPFVLPSSLRQWSLLIFIGVSGFVMQFLLTAGLRLEKSSRATNMVFVQMVFALAFDWGVWGVVPGWMEWVGSCAIVASAVGVAVQKERVKGRDAVVEGSRGPAGMGRGQAGRDEEMALMVGEEDGEGRVVEMEETTRLRQGVPEGPAR